MWLSFAVVGCPGVAWIAPSETPLEPTGVQTPSADSGSGLGPDLGCGPGLRPDEDRPLERWPYVQSVTPTSATVVWGSSDPAATGVLRWGDDPGLGQAQAAEPTDIEDLRLLVATLTGLQPSTTYCYAVSVDGSDRITGLKFHTAPVGLDATADFVAFGDYGAGTEAQRQIRDQIGLRLDGIDLWFTTGDNAYSSGRYSELQANVFDVYADQWHGVPVFPTPGNHDYSTDRAQPYLDNFVLPPNAWRPDDAERYYSVDWGPIHYVAVDGEGAILEASLQQTDDMLDWLDADLAGTDRPWKVVAWHKPPYEGHPTRTGDLLSLVGLVPLMEKHHVQLVLLGHNHYYERMKPILQGEASTLQDGGVTYVITGGGGQYLYPVEPWELQEVGISAYNFLVGHADTCTLSAEVYDEEGAELDRFTLERCR